MIDQFLFNHEQCVLFRVLCKLIPEKIEIYETIFAALKSSIREDTYSDETLRVNIAVFINVQSCETLAKVSFLQGDLPVYCR